MTEKFKEPVHFRPDKRDDEVRRAGMVSTGQAPTPPRYRPYQPKLEKTLDGKLFAGATQFKPDKPNGKKVAAPNDGPDTAWPGKYPSEPWRQP